MLRLAVQFLALLFTVFPWMAAFGPGHAKPEATLSSPHHAALHPAVPHPGGPASDGMLADLVPRHGPGLREALEAPLLAALPAPVGERRYLRFSRLLLDGG